MHTDVYIDWSIWTCAQTMHTESDMHRHVCMIRSWVYMRATDRPWVSAFGACCASCRQQFKQHLPAPMDIAAPSTCKKSVVMATQISGCSTAASLTEPAALDDQRRKLYYSVQVLKIHVSRTSHTSKKRPTCPNGNLHCRLCHPER